MHGFGAFGEQWRGQIKGLTEAGYQVFISTLPHPSFAHAVLAELYTMNLVSGYKLELSEGQANVTKGCLVPIGHFWSASTIHSASILRDVLMRAMGSAELKCFCDPPAGAAVSYCITRPSKAVIVISPVEGQP